MAKPVRLWGNAALLLLLVIAADSCPSFTANPSDQPIASGSTVYQLIQLQSDVDKALNVVFVPDSGYGDMAVLTNRQTFLDALEGLVGSGYWQNEVWVRNVHLTNFFYMNVTGTVAAPPAGVICPTVTWPAQADTDAAFADVLILVHTNVNVSRDCRSGRKASSRATKFRTVVHESSHAAFNLPDEYCCDGGYRELKPVMYDTQAECTSDLANAAWRNCVSFTATNGTVWWRSEDTTACIMQSGGTVVVEYGPADWVVVENVLDDLGAPNAPTVFAPTAWDRP